uniref:Uncharacterized protein n=1 Tax=Steinernema glaseri TaxID=37863 RepID=A0A1I7ZEK2_9BILA
MALSYCALQEQYPSDHRPQKVCHNDHRLRTLQRRLLVGQQTVSPEHVEVVQQHPPTLQPDEGAEFERDRKEAAADVDTHYEYDLSRVLVHLYLYTVQLFIRGKGHLF